MTEKCQVYEEVREVDLLRNFETQINVTDAD